MSYRFFQRAFSSIKSALKAASSVLTCEWRSAQNLRKAQLVVSLRRPSSAFRVVRSRLTVEGWAVDATLRRAAPVRAIVGGKELLVPPNCLPDVSGLIADQETQGQLAGFQMALVLPPGLRVLTVQAQAADGRWHIVRRTLLVVRRQKVMRRPRRWLKRGSHYSRWQKQENLALRADLQEEIRRHISAMTVRPTFSIVINVTRGYEGFSETLRSLTKQIYEASEICVVGAVNTNAIAGQLTTAGIRQLNAAGLANLEGSHCVFVDAGNSLHSHALYEFASAINSSPSVEVIYADEDVITERGRHIDPFFKPAWSPDYLEVFNYIEFPSCYRSDLAAPAYRMACLYDLALRITESAREVMHIPKVLGHRRQVLHAAPNDPLAAENALHGRLTRTGRRGTVAPHTKYRGCNVITGEHRHDLSVSVVIPTAGRSADIGGRIVDLVTNLVVQIRTCTTLTDVEILIIDDGTLTDWQARLLDEHRCRRVTNNGRGVNIARKINQGAAAASGNHLLILNDDIEVITPDWIERMLNHFQKPGVGVVGCRLLYPDHTIQHAGIVFVNGRPEHVRRQMPGDEAGYFFSTCGVRNYLAVTGACMMTPRDVFHAVGGYDEVFPLNFNDVDYCLKVRQHGRRVLYDGSIAMRHLESISRPPRNETAEMDLFARRWAAESVSDPFYNDRVLNLVQPAFEPQLNARLV